MTVTLTAAEQAVLTAVFEQIDLTRIDREKLRTELGSPTKNATSKRINRLREKLNAWAEAGIPSATTFTAAENSVLLAIFGQVDFAKVDKAKLQGDLGLPTKNAAGKRIARLREKFNSPAGAGTSNTRTATSASSAKKTPQSNMKDEQGSKSSTRGGKLGIGEADYEEPGGPLLKVKNKLEDVLKPQAKKRLARQNRVIHHQGENSGDGLGPDDEMRELIRELDEEIAGAWDAEIDQGFDEYA